MRPILFTFILSITACGSGGGSSSPSPQAPLAIPDSIGFDRATLPTATDEDVTEGISIFKAWAEAQNVAEQVLIPATESLAERSEREARYRRLSERARSFVNEARRECQIETLDNSAKLPENPAPGAQAKIQTAIGTKACSALFSRITQGSITLLNADRATGEVDMALSSVIDVQQEFAKPTAGVSKLNSQGKVEGRVQISRTGVRVYTKIQSNGSTEIASEGTLPAFAKSELLIDQEGRATTVMTLVITRDGKNYQLTTHGVQKRGGKESTDYFIGDRRLTSSQEAAIGDIPLVKAGELRFGLF